MKSEYRIEIRAVIKLSSEESIRKNLMSWGRSLASIGNFFSMRVAAYPKLPGSFLCVYELNALGLPEVLIGKILGMLGGENWNISADELEAEAIWSDGWGGKVPITPATKWVQVQAIPLDQLHEGKLTHPN
jgi:hypothetical protein